MGNTNPKCKNCGNDTARGFLADLGKANYFLAKWVEGEPERKEFLGLTASNVEVSGRRQLSVRALRCESCGYLELYAV